MGCSNPLPRGVGGPHQCSRADSRLLREVISTGRSTMVRRVYACKFFDTGRKEAGVEWGENDNDNENENETKKKDETKKKNEDEKDKKKKEKDVKREETLPKQ